MKMNTPKSLGPTTTWLEKPGTYHATILDYTIYPVPKGKTQPINGLEIMLAVLYGEAAKSQARITFYFPNENDEQWQQENAVRNLAALAIASGRITEAMLGSEWELPDDTDELAAYWEPIKNRQVVVVLEFSKKKTEADKQYLRLRYDQIYHIDDPRIAEVPKSVDMVKLLPASHRRAKDSFDMEKLGVSGGGSSEKKTNGQTSARQPVAAGVDVDDL